MPTKPRVEPDLTMQRALNLLFGIYDVIDQHGTSAHWLRAHLREHWDDYTAEERRAALKQLRERGIIETCSGGYRRSGRLF